MPPARPTTVVQAQFLLSGESHAGQSRRESVGFRTRVTESGPTHEYACVKRSQQFSGGEGGRHAGRHYQADATLSDPVLPYAIQSQPAKK
eukprot:362245-Chlamydomonas_euryale.AAC.5